MSEYSNESNGDAASEAQSRRHCRDDYRFPGERIAQLRIASRPGCLRLVRAVVNEAGDANGCSSECISQMVMAVDEACQNIIRHAYGGDPGGEIVVDIRREEDRISIHLLDFAAPVDVNKIKPRLVPTPRNPPPHPVCEFPAPSAPTVASARRGLPGANFTRPELGTGP